MKRKIYFLWAIVITMAFFLTPAGIINAREAAASTYEVLAAGSHDTELGMVQPVIDKTSDYYTNLDNAYQDGWKVMEMAVLGREANILNPNGTLTQYIEQATSEINPSSLAAYTKAVIVLTSLGIDAENLDDYGTFSDCKGNSVTNLINNIANFPGALDIYGAPFALLAYDSAPYAEPAGCTITRSSIIDYLLGAQLASGLWDDGWAAAMGFKDVDTTAMVITALAPYYNNYPANPAKGAAVKTALDKAVAALSAVQENDGTFSSWGSKNSNSTAMVSLSLVSLSIDPHTDPRFIKSSGGISASALDGIMKFKTSGGLFGWDSNTTLNDLSTEQVMRSMLALKEYYSTDTAVYLYRFGIPTQTPKTLSSIELTSPPIKSVYLLNEDLNLSGLSVKAVYADATKENLVIHDDMVSGYDKQTAGSQKITVTHQQFSCFFYVQVGGSSGGNSSPVPESAIVSLKVLDEKNASILNLAKVDITAGDSALAVLQKSLKANGITYSIINGYIKGIDGLFEKDNGPNSGWLYIVDGESPSVSSDNYKLSGGESIVFYYTNDYTTESDFEELEKVPEEQTGEPVIDATLDFPDEAKISSWARDSVVKATAAGIIHGDTQGYLNPKDPLSRAQWIVMLLNLQKKELPTQYEKTFSDVAKESWYWNYIQEAYSMGIISGKPDGSFGAGEALKREDLAVIIANLYGLQPPAELPSIADVKDASPYALPALYALYQTGIMTGDGKYINPQGRCTREEAITIIVRLMEAFPVS